MPTTGRGSKKRVTTKGGRVRKTQHINMLIEYRVEPEHLNVEDVLDKLREMGSAEIVETKIVDGPI